MPIDRVGLARKADSAAFACLFAAAASVTFSISLFEISSVCAMLLTLASVALGRGWRSFLSSTLAVLLGAYLLFNLLSVTQTDFPMASWRGMLKVFRHVLLCLTVLHLLRDEGRFRRFFVFVVGVVLLIGVDCLVQKGTGFEFLRDRSMTAFVGENGRVTGPYRHANDLSAYLSIAFFLCLGPLADGAALRGKTSLKVLAGGAFALTAFALLMSYSRTGWFSVAAALLLFAVYRRDRRLILALSVVAAWFILFPPPLVKVRLESIFEGGGSSVSERLQLWGESVRMIQQSPWLGLGVNTYAKNELLFRAADATVNPMYAHNGYLQMTAEIGILGLTSFLLVVKYHLWKALTVFAARDGSAFVRAAGIGSAAGVIAFLVHAMADTNLQSVLLVNMFWMTVGLGSAALRIQGRSPGGARP